MNNSLSNNSLTNNSTNTKDININNNILHLILELIRNNEELFIMIFYILLTICIWELCNNNCFDKRIKRKRNFMIQMGRLSHSSVN